MTDEQPDEEAHPMTQVYVMESMEAALTLANTHLRSAQYSKQRIGEADNPRDAIKHRGGFHMSVSLCLDSIWSILSWRELFEDIDAGINKSAEVFDLPEDITPETLANAAGLAMAAEMVLDELNTLTT